MTRKEELLRELLLDILLHFRKCLTPEENQIIAIIHKRISDKDSQPPVSRPQPFFRKGVEHKEDPDTIRERTKQRGTNMGTLSYYANLLQEQEIGEKKTTMPKSKRRA